MKYLSNIATTIFCLVALMTLKPSFAETQQAIEIHTPKPQLKLVVLRLHLFTAGVVAFAINRPPPHLSDPRLFALWTPPPVGRGPGRCRNGGEVVRGRGSRLV